MSNLRIKAKDKKKIRVNYLLFLLSQERGATRVMEDFSAAPCATTFPE